jgi:hypothetical protein
MLTLRVTDALGMGAPVERLTTVPSMELFAATGCAKSGSAVTTALKSR